MVSTLLLTITTCLSMTTGNLVEGQSIDRLKNKAQEMLTISANEYNPESFSFNEQTFNNDLKMVVLNNMSEYGLISESLKVSFNEQASLINKEILGKTDFSLDNLKQSKILEKISSDSLSLGEMYLNDLIDSSHYEKEKIICDNEKGKEIQITDENTSAEAEYQQIVDSVDENITDIPQIPLIANHDNSILEVHINTNIDRGFLIGFDFTKDTCITIYNIISNWLNKKAMLSQINKSDLWASIVGLISSCSYTTSLKAAVYELLSSVWTGLTTFFTTSGLLGKIIATILAITVLATIIIIYEIYTAGMQQCGWRIGLLHYNIFGWEWINEKY